MLARPLRHRLDRRVADHEVDHDDDRAELLGELGALVHLLHRAGGDVEVGALDLAGRGLRLVDRLHAVEEAVAPVHEGLRVDVLVVLGEVEAALQRLVDHAAVVAAGEAELRLHGGAEQRPAELVEPLALDDDAGGRALERLHIGDRQPHVLEPQRLQRLEAEHVADDRGRQVGDRARARTGRGRRRCRRNTGRASSAPDRRGSTWRGTSRRRSGGRSTPPSRSRSSFRRRPPPTASIGSTPSCGVTRNSAMMSVSFGS